MKSWKILLASLAFTAPVYANDYLGIEPPKEVTPPPPAYVQPLPYGWHPEHTEPILPYFVGEGEKSALQTSLFLQCTPLMGNTIKINVIFGEIAGDDDHQEISHLTVTHTSGKKTWNRANQYDMRQKVTSLKNDKVYEWAGLSQRHGRMIGILSLVKGKILYDTTKEYRRQHWVYTETLLDPFKRWRGFPAISTNCITTKIQAYDNKEERVSQK